MKELPLFSSKTQRQIGKQVLAGFAIAIIIGAILLSLPPMTVSGKISVIDALFTSTSAICVTGLIVQDTPTYFTDLGKALLLVLIQIGGLGIITVGSIFGLMLGRKIHIRDKFFLDSSFGRKHPFSAGRFFAVIVAITFTIEFIGFIALTLIYYLKYSYPIKASMTFGLFHSVSAFNNAGFSLYSNSLESFSSDISLNLVMMVLIVIGGLGFPVISELIAFKRRKKLSLHSKLVLSITGGLILLGTLVFFLLEFRNPNSIGGVSNGEKVLVSFFQSVTPRTAGFNTIGMNKLNLSTVFLLSLFMFIGASPGGTGGGIKTTTFAAVTAGALTSLRGRNQLVMFKRAVPRTLISRALTITLTAIVIVISTTIAVLILEKCTLTQALFESVSAFGTVGLTTGITMGLKTATKAVLVVSMFLGRIGLSTLSLAIAMRSTEDRVKHPEESITIG